MTTSVKKMQVKFFEGTFCIALINRKFPCDDKLTHVVYLSVWVPTK